MIFKIPVKITYKDSQHSILYGYFELERKQREIVTCESRFILALAGAGSGKTQTLTTRIAYLVKEKGVPVKSIMAMTFTRKAANEMKERAAKLCGVRPNDLLIGTFHSVCSRILRKFDLVAPKTRVIDPAESLSIFKQVCNEDKKIDKYEISSLKNQMDSAKNRGYEAHQVDQFGKLPELYMKYSRYCRDNDLIDFGDLLILVRNALRDDSNLRSAVCRIWKHVLIDEFQDTNDIQMQLIQYIVPNTSEHQTLMVVGDDYQTIHSWRGARVDNILKFEDKYPDAVTIGLEINYRSTKKIVDASNKVIANNRNQKHKIVHAQDMIEFGEDISVCEFPNEHHQAITIAEMIKENGDNTYDETAILYRTNAQSSIFEMVFREYKIPYVLKGAFSFFERKEVKDIIAYLKLFVNPNDDESFMRVINVPSRKIGGVTLKKIQECDGNSLFEKLENYVKTSKNKGAIDFHFILEHMRELFAKNPTTLMTNFDAFLSQSRFLEKLQNSGNKEESMERAENVSVLMSMMKDAESDETTLLDFLNDIIIDKETNESKTGVNLMSLHTSKGLEFDTVFMVDAIEDLLPHGKCDDVEEERRLMYVGMTRAKKKLVISYPNNRMYYGQNKSTDPSRFIDEIPAELVCKKKY